MYDFIKDIIIPLLGVLATIIVGVIIAYRLKSKEEKAKIKLLLIDNYMLYLDKKLLFFEYEMTSFKYQIFKDMYINYISYFEEHSNVHLTQEKVKVLRDRLKLKLENNNQYDNNWSPFTYRFAFLLGKKNYDKHIQSLENDIVQNYLIDGARKKFFDHLKSEIISNKEIVDKMNSSNTNKVVDALDSIEYLIAENYNNYQFKIFNPFDTKIANMIDQY